MITLWNMTRVVADQAWTKLRRVARQGYSLYPPVAANSLPAHDGSKSPDVWGTLENIWCDCDDMVEADTTLGRWGRDGCGLSGLSLQDAGAAEV